VRERETLKDAGGVTTSGREPLPVPGLVLVFSVCQALSLAIPAGAQAELGRTLVRELEEDERMSRRHASISFEGGKFRVEDLGSSNGTFVRGQPLREARLVDPPEVLRMGQSLFLLLADVGFLAAHPVRTTSDGVLGPRLARVFGRVDSAARASDNLLILGESGTGKELAARRFHASSPRAGGPFVAVNCATVPEGIAERLLFGARKGAFSGATADAQGYLEAADGGTLFLDELADLDPAIQPKLLRVLETKEVTPLGDTRGRRIDLGVCAATLRDIPQRVAEGKFREDLYYRLGRPSVTLPPLRERPEEIPFLIDHALASVSPALTPDPAFVESCLLRQWPGNVRELLNEVRRAGYEALEKGRTAVEVVDFATAAGLRPGAPPPVPAAPAFPERPQIEAALRAESGNVTRAAQRLGLHRNQLRRWLSRNDVDPQSLAGK
jgi:transcriptional regulator with GAF, ATPase, and Fis domain